MYTYLRNFLIYFENVLHPAGVDATGIEKRKRRIRMPDVQLRSPESCNLRGPAKKQDKSRINPAP